MNTDHDRSGGIWSEQQQGAWSIRMWWPDALRPTGGPQHVEIGPVGEAPKGDVARGISTTVLRRLDLALAIADAQAQYDMTNMRQEQREEMEWHHTREAMELNAFAAHALLEQVGVSPRYLAVLSTAYAAAVETGRTAPAHYLAQAVERRPETIKDHLKKARRDGYLTSLPGKPGGELTDKAQEVLSEIDYAPFESGLEDWRHEQANRYLEKGK
ncbi:hypothetical protein ACFU7T_39620 [Streptomyces sp. NPDC057555]|uniref:hypothetical protein n=1 Tax=Streptomyces sp. NPDC057555 TaxID=3346166 RepID=UPI0036A1AC80